MLLARSLMNEPAVVLLDEPSAGLDLAGREQLVDALDHLAATDDDAPPLVVVTHHVEDVPTSLTRHAHRPALERHVRDRAVAAAARGDGRVQRVGCSTVSSVAPRDRAAPAPPSSSTRPSTLRLHMSPEYSRCMVSSAPPSTADTSPTMIQAAC